MASNPATTSDLAGSSLRVLNSDEMRVGERKLESAWNIITTEIPTLAARLDAAGTPSAFRSLVIDVQCDMVLRFLNNPEGKYEEAGDDYSFKRDSAQSTGAVYLSDSERARLSDGVGIVTTGAFTIRPAGRRHLGGHW